MSKSKSPSIVELSREFTIKLPNELSNQFHPADRFVLFPQGDTLILKRLNVLPITQIVEQATEQVPPPTMDEIDEIIYQVRQARKRS